MLVLYWIECRPGRQVYQFDYASRGEDNSRFILCHCVRNLFRFGRSVVGGREIKRDWLKHAETRALAGGIYLSFLIPGVMSLIAQVSGENKLIWRATFVIAAALGMYFTARLIWNTRNSTGPIGPFRRHRWIVIVLYLLVLIFGAAPELADPLGMKPLQVESILLPAHSDRARLDVGVHDSVKRLAAGAHSRKRNPRGRHWSLH